jgi:hypothetical protein
MKGNYGNVDNPDLYEREGAFPKFYSMCVALNTVGH